MTPSRGVQVRRLRLSNYRSIASCDLPLGDLAVLVGPNGAGKSNVVDALVFLKDALTAGLDKAVDDRGGAHIGRQAASGQAAPLVSVGVDLDGLPGARECVYGLSFWRASAESVPALTIGSESIETYASDGSVEIRVDRIDRRIETGSESLVLPQTDLDSSSMLLSALSTYEPVAAVRRALLSVVLSRPSAEAMRDPRRRESRTELHADAANTAAVLTRLHETDPVMRSRIDEYLGLMVPGVVAVRPRSVSGWDVLELEQRVGTDTVTLEARVMSDGTLRALGVLTALFSPSGDGSYGPVIVEEPETALHPAAAGVLLDAIRDASAMRQVLVTTHSGDLLEAGHLGSSELLAVRADNGGTRVGPLDAGGRLALDESLFSAGDLLRTDQLQPRVKELTT